MLQKWIGHKRRQLTDMFSCIYFCPRRRQSHTLFFFCTSVPPAMQGSTVLSVHSLFVVPQYTYKYMTINSQFTVYITSTELLKLTGTRLNSNKSPQNHEKQYTKKKGITRPLVGKIKRCVGEGESTEATEISTFSKVNHIPAEDRKAQ